MQLQGYYQRFLQMLSGILFPSRTLPEACKGELAVLLLLVDVFCANARYLAKFWK